MENRPTRYCDDCFVPLTVVHSRPSGSSIVRSLALGRSCLRFFLFIPTFISFRVFTTLLHYSCLFLPLASLLLFPCTRYTVWGTHPVHGIPVPYVPCWMVTCILDHTPSGAANIYNWPKRIKPRLQLKWLEEDYVLEETKLINAARNNQWVEVPDKTKL